MILSILSVLVILGYRYAFIEIFKSRSKTFVQCTVLFGNAFLHFFVDNCFIHEDEDL